MSDSEQQVTAAEPEKEPATEKEPETKEAEPETQQQQEDTKAEEESKPEATEEEAKPEATEQESQPEATEGTTEQEAKPDAEPKEEEEEEEDDDAEEPDDGVPRVLVTGASGYIALQLIKMLLEEGRFRVRGTVRSKKRKEKIEPLLNLVPDSKYPLRLIKADLQNAESWNKAVQSCSYVFHLASPFPGSAVSPAEEEEKLIRPAVDGTLNVLKACANAGTVKRVVLTSSVAAVSCGTVGNPSLPPNHIYSETDWSDEAACAPYERSKTKAERAAWDFMKELEEGKKFELVVLNPAYVQGPALSKAAGEGTKLLGSGLLNGTMSALPNLFFPIIDVRDVAAANIAAIEKPEAAGNRYVLASETVPLKEIAVALNNEFRPQGYKIATTSAPKFVMWMFKFINPVAKMVYPSIGKRVEYNTEKMRGELGIQPRKAIESMIDTCYSLIELGEVEKKPGYLGHPSTRPPPPPKEEPAAPEQSAGDEATPAAKEPESEPAKESESEPKEPESEPAKESESEPPKESESEPAKETESEPPKESESEPAKETESEPAKETESEPPKEPEAD